MNDVRAFLARFGFRRVWAIDFEYVAQPGHRPDVVCMAAKCLLTGATARLEGSELARCPFACGDDELFVAYYASAEASCFDVLGWPGPRRMLDLFAEFRRLTNGGGNAYGNGLIGALLHFGLPTIGAEEKTAMRDLIMRGGPWTDIERRQILDYCESDVDAVLRLLPALFQWLDHQTGVTSNQASTASRSTAELQKQVVHGFAQEAARAELAPQQPVQIAGAGEGWLIHSVDLTPAQERLALVFRAADGRAAGVALTAIELRQWLAILHGVWLAAGWPASVWPEWIQGEAKPSGQHIVLH